MDGWVSPEEEWDSSAEGEGEEDDSDWSEEWDEPYMSEGKMYVSDPETGEEIDMDVGGKGKGMELIAGEGMEWEKYEDREEIGREEDLAGEETVKGNVEDVCEGEGAWVKEAVTDTLRGEVNAEREDGGMRDPAGYGRGQTLGMGEEPQVTVAREVQMGAGTARHEYTGPIRGGVRISEEWAQQWGATNLLQEVRALLREEQLGEASNSQLNDRRRSAMELVNQFIKQCGWDKESWDRETSAVEKRMREEDELWENFFSSKGIAVKPNHERNASVPADVEEAVPTSKLRDKGPMNPLMEERQAREREGRRVPTNRDAWEDWFYALVENMQSRYAHMREMDRKCMIAEERLKLWIESFKMADHICEVKKMGDKGQCCNQPREDA